jgi:hypothetical protein
MHRLTARAEAQSLQANLAGVRSTPLRECTHDMLWLNLNNRTPRAVAGECMKVPRHVHLIVIPQRVSDRCP